MRKILSDRQWIVWLYLGCLAAASIFGAGYAVGKDDGYREADAQHKGRMSRVYVRGPKLEVSFDGNRWMEVQDFGVLEAKEFTLSRPTVCPGPDHDCQTGEQFRVRIGGPPTEHGCATCGVQKGGVQ